MDPPRPQRDPPPSLLSVGRGTPGAFCGGRRRQQHLRRAARPRHSPRSNLFCLRPTTAMATRRLRTTCWMRRLTTLTPPHKTTMSMSPPEDACRDGQFQVVPRAQALLDAVPQPPQPMWERGIPEALKFSMAHGKGGNSSEYSAGDPEVDPSSISYLVAALMDCYCC
uniref:Uncharacterized protein n=1 Tax=Triticum urartu TaxID=4572 RepID=A0A8R7Q722_TRIUA